MFYLDKIIAIHLVAIKLWLVMEATRQRKCKYIESGLILLTSFISKDFQKKKIVAGHGSDKAEKMQVYWVRLDIANIIYF